MVPGGGDAETVEAEPFRIGEFDASRDGAVGGDVGAGDGDGEAGADEVDVIRTRRGRVGFGRMLLRRGQPSEKQNGCSCGKAYPQRFG